MWFMHDFGGWGMLFGGIWMLVFWGGLIALVVWGVNRLTKRDDSKVQNTPLEIAKERYARGEVTKDQFEQIKKDLS
jgi:putative membrane protein